MRKILPALILTAISLGGILYFSSRSTPRPTESQAAINGVLRVSSTNRRYFTDNSGKAIYLTGSHNWRNMRDQGPSDPPPVFDYTGYLNFLQSQNHNFFRLWAWDLTRYTYGELRNTSPFPWKRVGPGTARDGKLKFDLNQLDQAYFDRLRSRVIAARDRGIYVSVMLFEGHSINNSLAPWRWDGHPMNVNNNVNSINGDPNNDGKGLETQTLTIPAVRSIQEAYIRKTIDTVNDLDNVLYEIVNEAHPGSQDWQYAMINYIKSYEATKAKQHLVGMTVEYPSGNNAELLASPADWISPNDPTGDYRGGGATADGSKVVILDTDHLWGVGGDSNWVWRSFMRGFNPIYMDPYGQAGEPAFNQAARDAMGDTLRYANKMNLVAMTPQNALSSTGYVLANPGNEYLVYKSNGTTFTVNLTGQSGTYSVEWFNVTSRTTTTGPSISAGTNITMTPPFSGNAVLYLKKTSGTATTPAPTTIVTPRPSPTVTPRPATPTPVATAIGGVPTATPTKQADANRDGQVNETDYNIWLTNYGKSLSGSSNGDFNNSGKVDGVDYAIWANGYGK